MRKYLTLAITLLINCCIQLSTVSAQNDTIYFMKDGLVIHKQSIKKADLDSVIFYQPVIDAPTAGTFIDTRDGTGYNWVKIGDQIWMAENLRYLPSVVGPETGSQITPYYYVYDYDGTDVVGAISTTNYYTYGVLYNWPAAMNEEESSTNTPSGLQGVCPDGWHLPSDAEWAELEKYLSDNGYRYDGIAGGERSKIGKSLASSSIWERSSNEGAIGNTDFSEYINKSGFTALPGGYRFAIDSFSTIGFNGYWWCATQINSDLAWHRFMINDYGHLFKGSLGKMLGLSVRCVRNIPTEAEFETEQ